MRPYICTDDYKDAPEDEDWALCKDCGLRPKIWRYDNGRSTACGCGENQYKHKSISAESINSVFNRTGITKEYDYDALRKNWNMFQETGEVIFDRKLEFEERGRW